MTAENGIIYCVIKHQVADDSEVRHQESERTEKVTDRREFLIGSLAVAGLAVTVPKGTPSREIRLRSNAEVGNDFLQLSLAVTFRRTADEVFHPLHAAMRAKVMF